MIANLSGGLANQRAALVLGEAEAGGEGGEGGGAGDVQVEGPELSLGGAGGQQLGEDGADAGLQAEVGTGI